ncbi:MAG: ABC transporter permease, partial [Oscillospiraceae bacterium]|nr:ABC transporter permease [Oscillospiraceae bacterium]
KTTLGVIWSVLNPLAEFLILMMIFKNLFGRTTPHYTIYMLVGILTYGYFSNATTSGMQSFLSNAAIIQKIKLPIWLFPLSKNVSALINFFITLILLIPFMIIDGVAFTWKLIFLIVPIILLFLMNYGISLILASLYIFFKDVRYFYSIFCRLLYFCCAVFWYDTSLSEQGQKLLHINPIYDFITYSRSIIIHAQIPSLIDHLILIAYTVGLLLIGFLIYHYNKEKFVFYL